MTQIHRDKYGVPTIESIRAHLAHRRAIGRVGRNREDGFCDFHEREEIGCLAWHARARGLMRAGQKQVRCADCGKWLWPHELGNPLADDALYKTEQD